MKLKNRLELTDSILNVATKMSEGNPGCINVIMSILAEDAQSYREERRREFSRGWFACLAVLCKLEGLAGPNEKELWAAGGHGEWADPCDLETLAGYGLKPKGRNKRPAGVWQPAPHSDPRLA